MNTQSFIPWESLNSEQKIERLHEETKELFSRVAKLNDHTFVDDVIRQDIEIKILDTKDIHKIIDDAVNEK